MRSQPSTRRGVPARRVATAVLAVLALLLVDALAHRPAPAAAHPPSDVLPAAVQGYDGAGLPGVVAVVVATQHQRVDELTPRAAEARAERLAAAWADNGWAAARRFPTASLVKLFVAEDVLRRVREGQVRLRPGDRDLLRRMITASDDPAASALWVRYRGERMVRAVARRYDLTGTAPPAVRGQWGSTTTTARDLARFLALLPVVAHPDDAATLLGWMRETTRTAADGFDQRFGLFGGGAAVKQGWMCCLGGRRHVHSVGVVDGTVVVLLAEVPDGVGYDAVRRALTSAADRVPASPRT